MGMIGLLLLGSSLVLAYSGYLFKPIRLFGAGLALIVCGMANGLLFSEHQTIWGCISLWFGVLQLFNIARFVRSRLHTKHLKNAFVYGGLRLLGLQLLPLGIEGVVTRYIRDHQIFLFIFWLQVEVAILILLVVLYRIHKTKAKTPDAFLSDSELPSISVLVPARNEDANLEELLRQIVANDYPKMEVIVLDDCSVSSRIPEIVKGFAHDGVRFIQGEEIRDNWLAKNQAYDTLIQSSSGDYIICMGVDVRLGVRALRSLVQYTLNNKLSMVSVMPRRFEPSFWKGFFSPLRYMRELLRPGYRVGSEPTLSTMWVIQRNAYDSLGGMRAVARKVLPEQYFAKQLAKQSKYAFVRSGGELTVATAKVLREQMVTTVRVAYPSQHRKLEVMGLSTLAMTLFMLLPFVELVHSLIFGHTTLAILSGVAVCALTISHMVIIATTNSVPWPLAIVNLPYLVGQEVVLNIISMYRYEFGEVFWKGRNICLPVMEVIPKLPKLE